MSKATENALDLLRTFSMKFSSDADHRELHKAEILVWSKTLQTISELENELRKEE